MDIYVPPRDKNSWSRFRDCVSSFYEVVTDPSHTMQSLSETQIALTESHHYIRELERELADHKSYKERFEALEKAQTDKDYETVLSATKKQL